MSVMLMRYLTESHSGAMKNKMERARVIGCIRVVRKLMPLETVCK